MQKQINIMGHLVIGYPTFEESFNTAITYIQNGIEILELQIPFSDPTADGETITIANKIAIQNGISIEDCFEFVERIKGKYPEQEIYFMTYSNKILSQNWSKIENKLIQINVNKLIIPDLPFDSIDADEIQKNNKIKLVPVIGVNIKFERLLKILNKNPEFIYIMSGFRITGSSFNIHSKMKDLIKEIRKKSTAKIGIGFGVNSYKDVLEISELADVVIVGSSLLEAHKQGNLSNKIQELKGK